MSRSDGIRPGAFVEFITLLSIFLKQVSGLLNHTYISNSRSFAQLLTYNVIFPAQGISLKSTMFCAGFNKIIFAFQHHLFLDKNTIWRTTFMGLLYDAGKFGVTKHILSSTK